MTGSERLRPFELGDWTVRPSRLLVERDGERAEVEPKAMEVLLVLVERPGESFTRRELLDRVWPDVVVGDEALTRAIYVLRKALGDESRDPTYIETIPKIGYRLLPRVAPLEPAATGDAIESASGTGHPRLRRVIMGLGSIVLAGAAAWVLLLQGALPDDAEPRPFRVTSDPGIEAGAAPSPSGDRIAYSRTGSARRAPDLYVQELDGARPLRLTSDSLSDHSATWSPDGRSIAFLRTGGSHCRLLLISALGGPEREIAPCEAPATHEMMQHLDWSPDGRWIAWSDGSSQPARAEIRLIDMETREVRTLADPDGEPILGLRARFSPDGGELAFTSYTPGGARIQLVPFQGGEATEATRVLASDVNNVHGLSWGPDGRFIHFSSDRDGMSRLYYVAVGGGRVHRTNLGYEALRPVVVPARDVLVYEEWVYDTDLHAMPIDGEDPAVPDEPIVDSTQWDSQPSLSPDGRRLAFMSNRTGWAELYVTDARGGEEHVPLTDLRAQGITQPSWSPDGQRILFAAQLGAERTGRSGVDVYVIDEPGTVPRILTRWSGHEVFPSWSPDGKWVVFGSERGGSWQIWRVPVGGGDPQRVTTDGGFVGRVASDGTLLYTKRDEDGLWSRPLEGSGRGETLVTSEFPREARRWLVRGNLVHRLDRSGTAGLRMVTLDVSTGAVTSVRDLPEGSSYGGSFDLSPDGSRLYFARLAAVGSDLQAIPIPGRGSGVGELVAGLR